MKVCHIPIMRSRARAIVVVVVVTRKAKPHTLELMVKSRPMREHDEPELTWLPCSNRRSGPEDLCTVH